MTDKVVFKPSIPPYPAPLSLVGAMVNDKPNYLAVAWFSAVSYAPPMMLVALNKAHYTNFGIYETGEFSICIPSQEMTQITDYCGLISGHKQDKSKLFSTYFGTLKKAPLIDECPLSIELKLVNHLEAGANELFIGEITAIHCHTSCLTEGKPDLSKIKPFSLDFSANAYRGISEIIDNAWDSGKSFKQK